MPAWISRSIFSPMGFPNARHIAFLKGLVFAACLTPLAVLVVQALQGALGANPIEAVIRSLGDWALRFLLVTLAVTPLRRLTGWPWLVKFRRMLGLFAFFYAVLHLMAYVGLDQFFDGSAIGRDILKRPFITLGFMAFLLLIPLAVTSTQAMIRRLGGRRWQTLHRAVYAVAVLGVLHYFWLVKLDLTQPLLHAGLLGLLLGARILWRVLENRPSTRGLHP
ncbi:protein-L-methionine sulfoxide reductase heme-binding subunit MsrQ [Gammaproteobacteria bacterium]